MQQNKEQDRNGGMEDVLYNCDFMLMRSAGITLTDMRLIRFIDSQPADAFAAVQTLSH